MTTKEIEILIDTKLEKLPLSTNETKFYKIYLPEKLVLKPDSNTLINFHFKIKIPHETQGQIIKSSIFKELLLELYSKPLSTETFEHIYWKISNKSKYFTFTLHKNLEVARLYVFDYNKTSGTTYILLQHGTKYT